VTEADTSGLAAVIRERSSEILAAWIVQFERSLLRFRRATKAATHTAQVANLVEALSVAVSGGTAELRPGSNAIRELERSAAFLGAQFASEGATGFDIAALLLELRDVVGGIASPDDAAPLTRLFEWLTVVALDAFAAAGLQSLREQTAEQLDAGTPIVELVPKVPAVFLVGLPSGSVLESILARAWMLAVGTGAPSLVIDCAGLAAGAERSFERAFGSFAVQADGSALHVLLSGARRQLHEPAARLAAEHGIGFAHFERADLAIANAIERAGHLLMRRG
jgi:hypothetical protein